MVFYEGWVSGDPQVQAFLAQDPARITQLWRDYLADLTESESIARLAIATSECGQTRYTLSLLAMPERARGAEALMNYTLASIVLSWKLGISHDTALDTMLRTAHLGSQVVVDGGSLASTRGTQGTAHAAWCVVRDTRALDGRKKPTFAQPALRLDSRITTGNARRAARLPAVSRRTDGGQDRLIVAIAVLFEVELFKTILDHLELSAKPSVGFDPAHQLNQVLLAVLVERALPVTDLVPAVAQERTRCLGLDFRASSCGRQTLARPPSTWRRGGWIRSAKRACARLVVPETSASSTAFL